MALPTIALTGNLTADPELRFTASGKAVTKLRVACSNRIKNQTTGQWEDGDTVFIDVSCWKNADQIAESLGKGNSVAVVGRLKQRTYTDKQGFERTAFEVDADEVSQPIKGSARSAEPRQPAAGEDPWASSDDAWGQALAAPKF